MPNEDYGFMVIFKLMKKAKKWYFIAKAGNSRSKIANDLKINFELS